MNTPIYDFLTAYADRDMLRLHMPGHKGKGDVERYDLTEICGADSLYEADGIIRESEENAGKIFSSHTFYSTEGSSLSIRAMLYLVNIYSQNQAKKAKIIAARNAHKVFVSAAAMLDIEVEWLPCSAADSYLSSLVGADDVAEALDSADGLPSAVYITSPDYLGRTADIAAIAEVCHRRGVLLLVDNAHGAYLKFLAESRHPIDLGADITADSAHKTLPVLTGGAYLHISKNAPSLFAENARLALSLFGSTSPSYLILSSLDRVNAYLDSSSDEIPRFAMMIEELKAELASAGYSLVGDEPFKITVRAKEYGYTGTDFAELLRRAGAECEFSDPDFTVLMLTPSISDSELSTLAEILLSIPKREPITELLPAVTRPRVVLPMREALLCPSELVPPEEALGRIAAAPTVGCPPAVPIVISGELIDECAVSAFKYYGVELIRVVK